MTAAVAAAAAAVIVAGSKLEACASIGVHLPPAGRGDGCLPRGPGGARAPAAATPGGSRCRPGSR